MGAARPGAGPGEGRPVPSGQLPTRCIGMRVTHRDRRATCSLWPWEHLALCPERVFVTSPQERSPVPGLELETLNFSLPLVGCQTFV